MLLLLDLSYDEAKRNGKLRNLSDLHEAIIHGRLKAFVEADDGGRSSDGPDADHVVDPAAAPNMMEKHRLPMVGGCSPRS